MRKAQEEGRESEVAGSNVLLTGWRPVAGYCVRRDEDVERQCAGFKAWQLLSMTGMFHHTDIYLHHIFKDILKAGFVNLLMSMDIRFRKFVLF